MSEKVVETKKVCRCKTCRHSPTVRKILAKLSPREQKYMTTLANYYLDVDDDREYRLAILKGHWPSSVEILERALEKAKKFKEQENVKA